MLPHPTKGARCELGVSHMLSRYSTSKFTPATKTIVYGILRVWNSTLLPFQTVLEKNHHLLSKPKGLSENNITETLLKFKLILNILFLLRKCAQLYLSQNEQLVLYLELDSLFYRSSVSYTTSPCF